MWSSAALPQLFDWMMLVSSNCLGDKGKGPWGQHPVHLTDKERGFTQHRNQRMLFWTQVMGSGVAFISSNNSSEVPSGLNLVSACPNLHTADRFLVMGSQSHPLEKPWHSFPLTRAASTVMPPQAPELKLVTQRKATRSYFSL